MDFEDDLDEGSGDPLEQLKSDLLEGMREYIAGILDGGGDAGYTAADIGECGRVLDALLATVAEAERGDEDTVLGAVQYTVLSLNKLNARCDGHLIETDQRDQLRELINRAAASAGVGSGRDLTAEWREW